jgi:ribosome-binding protein aMBF1 (putative translation factor)
MTQCNRAQHASKELASPPRARVRSVAAARADVELQIRAALADTMALADPAHVKQRMKELRKRAGNPSQYTVAHELNVPPRTFQSWENAEVETDRENYEKVAKYYRRKLKEPVSANWILFGQDERPPLETPDLGAALNTNRDADLKDQLDRIEAMLRALLTTEQIKQAFAAAERDRQEAPGSQSGRDRRRRAA